MDKKKLYNVCKNIFAITITICLLIYFIFAEQSLHMAFANVAENTEESEIEAVTPVPDSVTQEEATARPEADVTEEATATPVADVLEEATATPEADVLEEATATPEPEVLEEATPSPEAAEAAGATATPAVVVASITYSYAVYPTEAPLAEGTGQSLASAEYSTEQPEQTTSSAPDSTVSPSPTESPASTESPSPTATPSPEIITESEEYYTLDEAFSGAAGITQKLAKIGIENYIPSIQLLENIESSEIVSNTDNASFTLDFNGYNITLSKEAYIDFGSGNIIFTDEQYIAAKVLRASGQQTEDVLLGGVKGDGLYMLTGTGNMSFVMGYYESDYNASGNGTDDTDVGCIINNADCIQFEDGYYISDKGRIINKTNTITVNGGFYSYDISSGLCRTGKVTVPDGMALVKTEILLGDVTMTGFMLGIPGFKVSVKYSDEDGKKEINSYFADFAGAWEQAVFLSSTHDMALASISIYNEEIKGVSISQTYKLKKSDSGKEAAVSVNGINMKRADGYEGNMFVVNGGKLVLNSCTLDGSLLNDAVSDSSLIRVLGSAQLSLKDTIVENNCSTVNEKTGDKGAGIYLAAESSMTVSGLVRVFGNTCYTADSGSTQSEKTDRNVYMEDGAAITVGGAIAGAEETGHIGITHENGIIAGLTRLGKLSADFMEERLNASEDKSINVDDVMAALTSDDHPSYYLTYDSEKNAMYWDTSTRYLPEAGVLRLEIILLIIGLMCFISRSIPACKKNKPVYAAVTVTAILCLLGGSVTGAAHLQNEKELYYENMRVVEQMAKQKTSKTTTADVNAGVALNETGNEEPAVEVYAGLDVPDDGREYYGIVEIPKLGIKLPVLSEYSDANMKTTPCVYYGDIRDNNLVIVGHNYDTQFAGLNNLDGDIEVILTLMDGSVHSYKSCDVESLEPDDVDEMLMGQWDLTLFTCNYAGDKRIAVRCVTGDAE